MHRIFVIAKREYFAAIQTKAFLIGLLMMPLLMGGSIAAQRLLRDFRDLDEKKFVVIDHTGGKVWEVIKADVDKHNKQEKKKDKQTEPTYQVTSQKPDDGSTEALQRLRFELSEKVREGELVGFAEIGRKVFEPLPPGIDKDSPEAEPYSIRYQTNRPTFPDFINLVRGSAGKGVVAVRVQSLGLQIKQIASIIHPVTIQKKGLSEMNDAGEIVDASESGRIAPFLVPFGLLMLMFMAVMMTATPLMQSVVEEKMQRIAEVLLGSVQPFELMMGKLIGSVGVSLTIVAVYLGGAYWAASEFGFLEYLPMHVLAWFLFFQVLAALMYGSLFIAVGAACTDMKETQSLLLPVMLIVCLPFFVMVNVLQEPNGAIATAVSFFPFATPMLMTARQAIPPGIPWWQPFAGALIVLATTVVCVYAAGRIFRVGLLMQGKGAKIKDIVRWVVKG